MSNTRYSIPIVFKSDNKGIKDAENGLIGLVKFDADAAIAIGAAFVAATAAAVAYGAEALKAAAEAESITRGLENAAKNAGVFGDKASSIGKATEALDKHSKKLGELTGIDDEIINQIKTGWLAVPALAALGTDGLNKLAEVVADTAAGTGKDVTAIGLAFQRIAGDTETAFSKLTRAGIVFTDEQKATFDSILATNGEMAAQAYLVEELGRKYEGAAEASANPFERLDVIMGNLQETIGAALLPAFEDLIPQLQAFIDGMVEDPAFQQFLADMGTNFGNILNVLPGVFDVMGQIGKDAMPAISAFFPALNEALGLMGAIFFGIEDSDPASSTKDFADSMTTLRDALNGVAAALKWLTEMWNGLPSWLKMSMPEVISFLATNPFTGTKTKWWTDVFGPDKPVSTPTTGRPYRPGGLRLAEGGIVMPRPGGVQATIAEAGQAEAVIPLDRLGKMGGGGSTFNITVNAGMGTDGAALGEQIVNAIRRYERTSGAVFARA
jgi:hypothetical protein